MLSIKCYCFPTLQHHRHYFMIIERIWVICPERFNGPLSGKMWIQTISRLSSLIAQAIRNSLDTLRHIQCKIYPADSWSGGRWGGGVNYTEKIKEPKWPPRLAKNRKNTVWFYVNLDSNSTNTAMTTTHTNVGRPNRKGPIQLSQLSLEVPEMFGKVRNISIIHAVCLNVCVSVFCLSVPHISELYTQMCLVVQILLSVGPSILQFGCSSGPHKLAICTGKCSISSCKSE